MMPAPEATNRTSPIEPGRVLTEEHPLFLLKNDTGFASLTAVNDAGVHTFVLGFTSLERAKAFVAVARQPDGPLRIRSIVQMPMGDFTSRRQEIVALDVDPHTLQTLTAKEIGAGSSVIFSIPTRSK